jgi:SAM-dependent methyltransferase
MANLARVGQERLVLDLACGRGSTSRFLAKRYDCHVIGLDLSRKSISIADRRAKNQGQFHRVTFAVANAEHLPLKSETFDIVVSECSFSLLNNKKACAREINRVLKPNGILALDDITHEELSKQRELSDLQCPCFAGAESVEEYKNIFEQVGFDLITFEDHSMDLRRIAWQIIQAYGSLDNYWNSLNTMKRELDGVEKNTTHSCRIPGSWCEHFSKIKPGYAIFIFEKK